MKHPLQCQCGTVKGTVDNLESGNQAVCYCKDCQMFAHFLGKPDEILDERGGTHVIQTLPMNVNFTSGSGSLACIRLTDNGLLRWYSSCCNTPIGNTLASFKISFVGLIHNCLESPGKPLGSTFGPIRARVNTGSAKGLPRPKVSGMVSSILRIAAMLAKARIDGSYKHTPFFLVERGTPVATPRVLRREELESLKDAV